MSNQAIIAMNKGLVSVIVPVYNVEQYLDRCLTAIVHQSYSNLEIILIDDGSTDNSGDICDKWASTDERIIVKHQDNAGQSCARNLALSISKGDYIAFSDGDDYFSNNAIEKMIEAFDDPLIGIVSAVVHRVDDKGNDYPINENWEVKTRKWIDPEDVFFLMYNCSLNHLIHNKLFKRSVVESVLFPEKRLCEDQFFSLSCSMRLEELGLSLVEIPELVYYYTFNPTGTTSYYSAKMDSDWKTNKWEQALIYSQKKGIDNYKSQLMLKRAFMGLVEMTTISNISWQTFFSILPSVPNTENLTVKSVIKFFIIKCVPSIWSLYRNLKKSLT